MSRNHRQTLCIWPSRRELCAPSKAQKRGRPVTLKNSTPASLCVNMAPTDDFTLATTRS